MIHNTACMKGNFTNVSWLSLWHLPYDVFDIISII